MHGSRIFNILGFELGKRTLAWALDLERSLNSSCLRVLFSRLFWKDIKWHCIFVNQKVILNTWFPDSFFSWWNSLPRLFRMNQILRWFKMNQIPRFMLWNIRFSFDSPFKFRSWAFGRFLINEFSSIFSFVHFFLWHIAFLNCFGLKNVPSKVAMNIEEDTF